MNGTMRMIGRVMIVGLATLCAAALYGCSEATPAPSSGFAENTEMMSAQQGTPFQRAYWNRSFDPKSYDELYIAPVNTDYIMAQNFWEKASLASIDKAQVKKDVATIAEFTRQSFMRAVADDPRHRFKLVDKPGEHTLILELALTQLVPSKAVLNAIGYVTWIPTVVALGGSTATQSQDTGKGVVAIEGRVRDGSSGEIIGMFADRQHPATAIIDLKALNWWAPARGIIDQWSKQLVALANRPAGAVVKDMPQFELLVW